MGRSSHHPASTLASCSYSVIRGEDQITDAVLCGGVEDRPEQGEAAALAIDRVLPCRERDVATSAGAAFPDGEADQLQPASGPSVKCSSASASLPGGLPLSFGVILIVSMTGTFLHVVTRAGRAARLPASKMVGSPLDRLLRLTGQGRSRVTSTRASRISMTYASVSSLLSARTTDQLSRLLSTT